MFDLMGAIRKKQQAPPPADSAETAESPQPQASELADGLRKTADFSAGDYFSATLRKSPQTPKTCKPLCSKEIAGLSANPQNPQPPAEQKTQNPDALLLELAQTLQASPDRLRALLSEDDMQAIAEGEHSRTYLMAYFRLMRSDGIPLTDDQPLIPCTARAQDNRQRYAARAEAWEPAFDAFIDHLMAPCPNCYAPRGRYCSLGAELHHAYNTACERFKADPGTPLTLSCSRK